MLRYSADIRTLCFVATYFLLFFALWFIEMPTWATALTVAVTCVFSWFCAVITHNAIHCPVFRSRRANRIFQVILTLTYGHPVSAFVPGHNLSHHTNTQTQRDVMRTTKVRYRSNLLNLLLFFPTVAGAIMRGDIDFGIAMRKYRPRWFRQFMIEAGVFLGVSVILLLLSWKKFLLFWYLPHFWAAFGIVTINYLQHDGADQNHPYNHSRNFSGKLFGWWTFNNGFHAAHHISPATHWSELRAMHERDVAPHIDPRLVEPSIVAYCWRTFVWPGKRLRYDGQPVELPAPAPDESWIPSRSETPPDVSLGAVS